jgi:hypothetical protein
MFSCFPFPSFDIIYVLSLFTKYCKWKYPLLPDFTLNENVSSSFKLSIIKFHENLLRDCRVHACAGTERWTNIVKLISKGTCDNVFWSNKSCEQAISSSNTWSPWECYDAAKLWTLLTNKDNTLHILLQTNSRHIDMDICGFIFVRLFCNALKSVHHPKG